MSELFSNEITVAVGSARINGKKEFVMLYIEDGKIYKVSISLLKELLKGKKRFIKILTNTHSLEEDRTP